jgi:protein-tyrosine phosphatase
VGLVIDLHCHVLPGIDDGPETVEGSLALARAAEAAGTRTLVATPHVSWRHPNDPATIARLTDELNARLRAEEIALEVRPGAELALTRLADIEAERLPRFALGGGEWLLVEPPFTPIATGLDVMILDLQRGGRRVVLAHPERCHAFQRDPAMLARLVRAGALTSITAGSLTGHFGGETRRFALQLLREGMVHNVASDAHDAVHRPPVIAAELASAGVDEELADWLARRVPAAILDGGEIPPRPAGAAAPEAPRRRWWGRHR